jgi:molybdopterin-guanine dinucleotide biosynthesis protein A
VAIAAVVLAGGARDAVARLDPAAANKAFVRVGGEALVARTIAALRRTPSVGRIVAVAPFEPQALALLSAADEIRRDGARITDSLREGLRGLPADDLVLVCASDLPILSAAAVEEFIELAERSQADAVYACVERATHVAHFPSVPHTWARLSEGTFCGGGCVALRPRVFPALERFLERLGAARKNPLHLARIFGYDVLARYALGLLSVADAERRAGRLLGAPVAAAICSHAEIAVNVDRESDVELAKKLVAISSV